MTFLLTKIFLKSSIQKMGDKYAFTSNAKSNKNKLILYGLLLLYLIGVIGFLSVSLIDNLKEIHQETVFIGMILLLVLGVTIMQTIFSGINLLYFTKDTDSVLPLPIKPYQIILARTNVIMLVDLVVNIFVGLVPLLIYGYMLKCDSMFYISSIITLIILPILPVILISLLIMIIMSFSKITKNRNRFQLIATLLVIILIILLSVGMTKLEANTITDEQMMQMMTGANNMVNMIKGYFPTLGFGIDAITSGNIVTMIMQFAKIIGITAVGFVIYIFLAQKLYFKGLIGNLYSASGRRSGKVKISNKKLGLGKQYVGKEFKILFRNPVYLVQCVLPALLFPILIIFLVGFGMSSEDMQEMSQLTNMLANNKSLVLYGVLAVTQFFSMIIYVSATAISRDGPNAVFMKYIPVSLYKQYVYKTIPNIVMNLISTIVVLGIAVYLINISILDCILLLIVSIIMSSFTSFLETLVDLKRPKLHWSSEYAVVKQNMNLIFPMIFSLINVGAVVLFNYLLQNIPAYTGIIVVGVVFAIANIIVNKYMKNHEYKLAENIM